MFYDLTEIVDLVSARQNYCKDKTVLVSIMKQLIKNCRFRKNPNPKLISQKNYNRLHDVLIETFVKHELYDFKKIGKLRRKTVGLNLVPILLHIDRGLQETRNPTFHISVTEVEFKYVKELQGVNIKEDSSCFEKIGKIYEFCQPLASDKVIRKNVFLKNLTNDLLLKKKKEVEQLAILTTTKKGKKKFSCEKVEDLHCFYLKKRKGCYYSNLRYFIEAMQHEQSYKDKRLQFCKKVYNSKNFSHKVNFTRSSKEKISTPTSLNSKRAFELLDGLKKRTEYFHSTVKIESQNTTMEREMMKPSFVDEMRALAIKRPLSKNTMKNFSKMYDNYLQTKEDKWLEKILQNLYSDKKIKDLRKSDIPKKFSDLF